MLDDYRALEPPDPIPNSEVKRCIADGSVGLPHVRVGHRQPLNLKPLIGNGQGFFPYKYPLFIFYVFSGCQVETVENRRKNIFEKAVATDSLIRIMRRSQRRAASWSERLSEVIKL